MRSFLELSRGVTKVSKVQLPEPTPEATAVAPGAPAADRSRPGIFSADSNQRFLSLLQPLLIPLKICADDTQPVPSSSTASPNEYPLPGRLPEKPQNARLKSEIPLRSSPVFASSLDTIPQQCCEVPSNRQFRLSPRGKESKMALSKEQKISILLVIDGAFFLVELIIGYAVHSLALVADAFHMLNDVLSLCVGLWAVRVAQSGSSKMYTYGWQRAETLGALVNGVFLVALCVTIFLEAIQRFVDKPEVSNPKLVLIVGCLGLASNILGLFLFHDHSHSHGSSDEVAEAEEGHGHSREHAHSHAEHVSTPYRDIPEDNSPAETSPLMAKSHSPESRRHFSRSDEENTTISGGSAVTPGRKSIAGDADAPVPHMRHRRRTSGFGSADRISSHPAYIRRDIIAAASYQDLHQDVEEAATDDDGHNEDSIQPATNGHLPSGGYGTLERGQSYHANHNHNHPKGQAENGDSHGGHGHSHGDLNMRGVFLHVMGDALGNIGVIVTALVIWLTKFSWRFYFDPAISLFITVIILCSAIPLCKAASRILLQAVPVGMEIEDIKDDIMDLPQVVDVHHLHVWQLSDTKLIASLHVKVDCEVKGIGSASYMKLAREIRACLHGYGIHSSTIQPEFLQSASEGTSSTDNGGIGPLNPDKDGVLPVQQVTKGIASKAGSMLSADGQPAGPGCMLDCEDNCADSKKCCPPGSADQGSGR